MLELVIFWITALIGLGSALGVIFARNTVHSALFLVLHLLAQAALYVLLEAHFIAAVQVVVYAGAIMVLFLFVIMMLSLERGEAAGDRVPGQRVWAFGLGLTFLTLLGFSLAQAPIRGQGEGLTPERIVALGGNTEALGRLLFTQYLFAFEVVSVLLLVAMVGAVVLAKRRL
ncbi:MAG: NADH-quinone oxidoreductase subunit J [Chloroflexi bacterium]|nr:NADH-quinone oxidoreductase subunit J [Chloroflexota bacterium]